MPVTEDGRIIPSFDPNDFTEESIAADLNRMQAYLEKKAGTKVSPEDCPTDVEPFFSDEIVKELEDTMCDPDEPMKMDIPDIPETEISDETECVKNGLDAIEKAANDIEKDVEELSNLSELLPKMEEWVYNLEPIYKYHVARFNASNYKKSKISDPAVKVEKITELRTIDFVAMYAEFKMFTFAIGLHENLTNVLNVNFHYHWKDDIKESEYLSSTEKDYFLKHIGDMYRVTEFDDKKHAKGYLYKKYYSLFETPEESFFTLEERGLTNTTKNAFLLGKEERINVDTGRYITVKGSKQTFYVGNNERKYRDGKTLYQRYQEFYTDLFPNELYPRAKRKYKKDVINTVGYKLIISLIEKIGKEEGKCYNRTSDVNSRSNQFIKKYEGVLDVIKRVNKRIDELKKKLTKDNITEEIQKAVDSKGAECSDMFNTGGDTNTPDHKDGNESYKNPFGRDPNLPDYTKLCYWVKFCELATIYNATSPYPDLKNPLSFRYWPVGIVIPTPAKLIKIPFPTVFVPLMVVSLKIGTFVLIFAQTGIFPALEILFIANDGSKNFILAASVNAIKNGRVIGSENFGFNIDSEVELRTKFANTMKIFELPLLDPKEIIEAQKVKLENKKLELEGKIISSVKKDIETKYDAYKKLDEGDNIFDIIERWRKTINSKIAEIPDREIGYRLKDTNELKRELRSILYDDVDWPVFKFPEEMDQLNSDPIALKVADTIRTILSTKVGLVPRPDNLRSLVKKILMEYYDDSELSELINRLPEEIDLTEYTEKMQEKFEDAKKAAGEYADNAKKRAEEKRNEVSENVASKKEEPVGNIEDLKKFINDLIDFVYEKIDKNIWTNEGLQQGLANIQIANMFNPFECEPALEIEIPEFLDIDSIKVLISIMKSSLGTISNVQITALLPEGMRVIRRSQVLNIVLDLILKYVPPIPLIDINGTGEALNAQITSLIKMVTKTFEPISNISIDQVKDILVGEIMKRLGLPVSIDTRYFADKILDGAIAYLEKYIKDFEELYDQFSEMKVTTATLKGILYSAVNSKIDAASDFIYPYVKLYQTFREIYDKVMAIKEMGIDFNITEIIANPKETAKKLAERPLKAVIWEKIKKELGLDKLVHSPYLAQLAFEKLKEFVPLTEYHLVGSLCAFGGDTAKSMIRILHPISLGEDLPPYERLELNNPLFVVFLDGFCNEAKKLNGFDENYL